MTDSPPDRKRIVAEFIRRVWSEGDAGAVDDHLADHYTIRHDPGDPWDGRTLDREAFRPRRSHRSGVLVGSTYGNSVRYRRR